jgi:hypothetical protein
MFCVACLFLFTGGNAQAGKLGMHYFPPGWGCEFLNPPPDSGPEVSVHNLYLADAGWNNLLEQQIKPDLNHLAALNVEVVRFMIWPENCGYKHQANVSTRVNFDSTMKARLNAFVGAIGSRGMKLILNLTPNNGRTGPNTTDIYTFNPTEFGIYKVRMASLAGEIYTSLSAENQKHVLYFDAYDEADVCVCPVGQPPCTGCPDPNRLWDYVGAVLGMIPEDKRGLSLLHVNDDFPAFKNYFCKSPVRYLAFNTVPEVKAPHPQPNTVQEISAIFNDPYIVNNNITVLLGSFGIEKCYNDSANSGPAYEADGGAPDCYDPTINQQYHKSTLSKEEQQRDYIAGTIYEAETEGFPYYIHWHFADASPGTRSKHGWGLTYAQFTSEQPTIPEQPTLPLVNTAKSALGWLGVNGGPTNNNFDFETAGPNNTISGWWTGGTISSQLGLGSSWENTTSNHHYGSVYVADQSDADESIWMATSGGAVRTNTTLFVNFYYHSNLKNIRAEIHQYNASNQLLEINYSPSFTPPEIPIGWNNFQSKISGGWFLTLRSDTNRVVLVITGKTRGIPGPGYLDVDTVSMSTKCIPLPERGPCMAAQ